MAIQISRFERRDSADREAMARAALDVCRASRASEGARSARYFWTSTDSVAFMFDAESAEVFDRPPTPELLRAWFALSDLARETGFERWADPGDGERRYRAAGR